MYYGMIVIAVVMFGVQNLVQQKYQEINGSDLLAIMQKTFVGTIPGMLILLCFNGFRLECTTFTLIMAFVAAVNGVACGLFSLKALGVANLSLFSLFLMLGGMALPFCAGILFYDEPLTLGKGICLLTVVGAMLITRIGVSKEPGTTGKKAGLYYAGIFISNGMSGVLSKIFQAAPYEKTDSASYLVICAGFTILIAFVFLLFIRPKGTKMSLVSIGLASGSTILNRIANYLLLLALLHLPASVQYPMVTGGVMIVSTLISYFTPKKPGWREISAVALSFAGIMALVLL